MESDECKAIIIEARKLVARGILVFETYSQHQSLEESLAAFYYNDKRYEIVRITDHSVSERMYSHVRYYVRFPTGLKSINQSISF